MKANIFGRKTTVHIEKLSKEGARAIYNILHSQWSVASSLLNWEEADKLESDMSVVGFHYRGLK